MTKLFAGTLTVGLVLLLAVLFVGSATVRFNLISIHPAFWLFALGIVFVLGGSWLVTAKIPGGKIFATLGTVLLLLGGYKSIWPSTSKASSHAQEVADSESALAINDAVAPRPVSCDRTTKPKPKFFDPVTGKPLIWIARNEETDQIECYNRPGYHSLTRRVLVAVNDEKTVMDILLQDPPEGPKPAVTPEPVQVAVAPPVPTTVPAAVASVAPVVQPTPEPARGWWVRKAPREYSIPRGETVTVALTEPLDLGERGENFPFTGTLMSDVSDRNEVVLAKSGTRVDMMISSLRLDPRSNEVLLELEVTSLTTTGGTSLPVRARQNGPIRVRSVRTGMKRNTVKGALIGATAGGILGALRDGKRGAARDGAIGTVAGAGAGALLTKGQYILPPSQLQMTIEERWTVPRTMLADTQ